MGQTSISLFILCDALFKNVHILYTIHLFNQISNEKDTSLSIRFLNVLGINAIFRFFRGNLRILLYKSYQKYCCFF